MKQALDWEPSTSLEDGLREVYRWAEEELDVQRQEAVADGGAE